MHGFWSSRSCAFSFGEHCERITDMAASTTPRAAYSSFRVVGSTSATDANSGTFSFSRPVFISGESDDCCISCSRAGDSCNRFYVQSAVETTSSTCADILNTPSFSLPIELHFGQSPALFLDRVKLRQFSATMPDGKATPQASQKAGTIAIALLRSVLPNIANEWRSQASAPLACSALCSTISCYSKSMCSIPPMPSLENQTSIQGYYSCPD